MTASREVRFVPECRAEVGDAASPRKLVGYAASFNTLAKLPGFRECVLPGAFTRALDAKQDCVFTWNHSTDKILGRTTSGTLQLQQDSRGLRYVCALPNTEEARGYWETVRRGDVNGSSFAFTLDPNDQEWSEDQDPEDRSYFVRRNIRNVTQLIDCSAVAHPAYGNTDVLARSAAIVPVELRSAVDAKNRSRLPAKRSQVFVPPTFDACLQITYRAIERQVNEATVVARRKRILNDILNS
jgi:HK97 family phage prohead protease